MEGADDGEADGLLVRTMYSEIPPRVEYTLTDAGLAAAPIISALRDWGQTLPATRAPATAGLAVPAAASVSA